MPLVKVDCHEVICDYCKEEFEGDDYTLHVRTVSEASDHLTDSEWFIDNWEGNGTVCAPGEPIIICHNVECQMQHAAKHPGASERLGGTFWDSSDEEPGDATPPPADPAASA